MKKISHLVLGAILATGLVFAADASGKWTAETPGREGQTMTTTFNLKAEGGKLTGNMETARGSVDITDGKVDGDNVSFMVVRETPRGTMKMMYSGKVEGDELKMTVKMEGGPGEGRQITAKRAK
jgi:hypothetical protein